MNQTESGNAPDQQRAETPASLSIQSYEGPLPPPEYLRQYEEAIPGAGQKIVDMMVEQANHRAEVERNLVGSVAWLIRAAPIFNILMGILVVAGGLGAIQMGEVVLGRLIFGVGGLQAIVAIIAVLRSFLSSRRDFIDGHTQWSSRDID